MDITQLAAGHQLPKTRLVLDAQAVRSYRDAVGDASPLYGEDPSLVPPMAVAALSLRHMLRALTLPPGTVHAGQELSFRQPVAVGQEVVCRAQVSQVGQRKGWLSLVIEFQVDAQQPQAHTPALAGRIILFISLRSSP